MNARKDIPAHIRKVRGSLKLRPGEKPITQELLEDRAEDLRLEEAKRKRFESAMRRKSKKPGKGKDT
jgi:hypothetical protein